MTYLLCEFCFLILHWSCKAKLANVMEAYALLISIMQTACLNLPLTVQEQFHNWGAIFPFVTPVEMKLYYLFFNFFNIESNPYSNPICLS